MDTYSTGSKDMNTAIFRTRRPKVGRAAQQGVALVITLLTLSLITVLSLGMVIAFSSQTLIGGYYRNYRGAFYAADSGLNIARQKAGAQLQAAMPAVFSMPPANANACSAPSAVTVSTDYASNTSLNTGTAGQSWSENFNISNATIQPATALPGVNQYTCTYSYDITSSGSAQGSEQQIVEEKGKISVTVLGAAAPQNLSFSYFGAFVDQYPPGIGPLVPGTMTGPMFTNTAWEFMASIPPWTAPYIFSDPVGQVMSQVDYWDSGWGQHWSSATSWGSGSNLVAPTFQQGLQLNQTAVTLAPNTFNQEEAVVNGLGNVAGWSSSDATTGLPSLTNVTNSAVNWSSSTTSGVFAKQGSTAAACGTKPTPCVAGGGFVVEGTADVQLIPSGATAQIYKITQGSVVTTITVDPAANSGAGTTVISNGTTTQTLNGVPYNNVTSQPGTMLYVDGTMYFHGPGEGLGAIQDNAMITLTANGDAIATGDVLYKTEPVTVPLDTLVPGVGNQVLGIYTSTGSFITQDTQADQNIQVDGSIATILPGQPPACNGHSGGQLSYGHINTINNVGGMVQSCIYAADVNAENTWFDRRFTARPGFAPPWFPQTTLTVGGAANSNPQLPSFQRIQWLSKSSQ